jgi:hypothetical protein
MVGGSGVVIIKIPDTHSAIFSSGVDFGNNAPDYDNGLPITSVSGFNIYFVSGTDTASETVAFYENPSVDFLGVAGGGGGGGNFYGGGGGAGGYREFTAQTLNFGSPYTVTVGGGGNAGTSGVTGGNGPNSVFSTTESTGGGGGGGNPSGGAAPAGNTGGSGGGGGSATGAGGAGNTPVTSPSQGNNGATAVNSVAAGGGGGAMALVYKQHLYQRKAVAQEPHLILLELLSPVLVAVAVL